MRDYEMTYGPLIIGGSGGSGTRIVADICIKAGYYMGASSCSYASDSTIFEKFFDLWTRQYLIRDVDELDFYAMLSDFNKRLERHLNEVNDFNQRWGWKNTRTMFLLPFLKARLSHFKFIHVIRDGRDMVYSINHRQSRELFDVFFEVKWFPKFVYEASAMFWAKTNIITKRYGEGVLKDDYLIIRLEDLVYKTKETVNQIVNFLDLKIVNFNELCELVKEPATIGRWRVHKDRMELIESLTLLGLEEFRYELEF
jgi:hypothetical protein